MKDNLIKKAKLVCDKIAKDLQEHLQSKSIENEMTTWSDSEAPEFIEYDLEATRKRGNILLSLHCRA